MECVPFLVLDRTTLNDEPRFRPKKPVSYAPISETSPLLPAASIRSLVSKWPRYEAFVARFCMLLLTMYLARRYPSLPSLSRPDLQPALGRWNFCSAGFWFQTMLAI